MNAPTEPTPHLTAKEADFLRQSAATFAINADAERARANAAEKDVDKLKQDLERMKAKFDVFIRPETKPNSIDDATSREWDLSARVNYLNGRVQNQMEEIAHLKQVQDRAAGMIELFKEATRAREHDFEVGQAAMLARAVAAEDERDKLISILKLQKPTQNET